MPKITALIHCHGDAQQLARALETLHPCDQVLIVSHNPDEEVDKVARSHGASVKNAVPGVSLGTYLVDAAHDWILCLKATESLSDELEASLLEWKEQEHETSDTFAFGLRTQSGTQWKTDGLHTRLVNRTHVNWTSELPPDSETSQRVAGDLLHVETPQAA